MAFTYSLILSYPSIEKKKVLTWNDTHALAKCQHRAFTRPKKEGLLCKKNFSSFGDNESTRPWRPTILINAPDRGLYQSMFRQHYVSHDLAIFILQEDLGWFSHFSRSWNLWFSLGNGLAQSVFSLQRWISKFPSTILSNCHLNCINIFKLTLLISSLHTSWLQRICSIHMLEVSTAQEDSLLHILMCKNSSKTGWKAKCLSKDLVLTLSKMEMNSQRKQRQVTWKEYRDMVQKCRNRIRKAKAEMEWWGMWRITRRESVIHRSTKKSQGDRVSQ